MKLKLITNILAVFILVCLIFVNGCDDTVTSNDINSRIIPDSNVSFSKHLSPVFELKCTPCHGNGRIEASLNLTNPALFVDGLIVVPGDPSTSKLVWRIDPSYGTDPMPPIGEPYEPLNENQVKGVKTWITEGAENN